MTSHDTFLEQAIELSKNCDATRNRYAVGAVIVDADDNVIATGYTGEYLPENHAEEVALKKAKTIDTDLSTARIYSSLEPCSVRSSRPVSCCDLIEEAGIKHVIYALREPKHFVEGEGHETLEQKGIKVTELTHMADAVIANNTHLIKLES